MSKKQHQVEIERSERTKEVLKLKKRTITQAELEEFYKVQELWIQITDDYYHRERTLSALLELGSPIEPGVFDLQTKEWSRRHISWKSEFIRKNGQSQADAVYQRTVPTTYRTITWEGEKKHEISRLRRTVRSRIVSID